MAYAEKPPSCKGCPAYEVGKSYVPGVGPKEATLALIGQGPGETEAEGLWNIERQDWDRAPFIGNAGQELNRQLHQARLSRTSLYLDNVVRCWLPGNRAPKKGEREFCTQAHLRPTLLSLPNLKVVVPVGVPAIKWAFGEQANASWVGALREVEI